MTLVRRPPESISPRAAWAVPLGLGFGGILIAVIVIVVGVGYDVAGRSPPPLVLLGLSLLIGPQFWLARKNYVEQREAEQVRQLLRVLGERSADGLPALPGEGGDVHRG